MDKVTKYSASACARGYLAPEKVTTLVVHAPCLDGLAARVAALRAGRKFTPEDIELVEFNPATDGKTAEWIHRHSQSAFGPKSNILFVDCAPSLEVLNILQRMCGRVAVLDHHIGNERALSEQPGFFYDVKQSGCMLAWDYFNPDEPMPYLISCIGTHDTGEFDDTNVNIHRALIGRKVQDHGQLAELVAGGQPIVHTLALEGAALSDTIKKKCEALDVDTHLENTISPGKTHRFVAAKIDGYEFTNELTAYMLEKDPAAEFAVVYYKIDGGKYKLSFRTNKPEVDVAAIASTIGGNGHRASAGATVESLPWGITVHKGRPL